MLRIEGKIYKGGKETSFFAISEIKHIEIMGLDISVFCKNTDYPSPALITAKDEKEVERVIECLSNHNK